MGKLSKGLLIITIAAATVLATRTIYAADEETIDRGEVLAVVGGEKITVGDLEDVLESMDAMTRRQFEGREGRKVLLDILIKNKVMLEEADKVGIPKEKEIKERIRQQTERIIVSEYFRRYVSTPMGIIDEEVERYYNAHKEDFLVPARVKLRHIRVGSEAEAEDVIARLEAGEVFDELAKELSNDETTTPAGGLIGEITQGYTPSAVGHCDRFDEVVFSMEAGTYSEPVASDLGWHVFYVDRVTPAEYSPLENVAARIREKILVPDEDVKTYYLENKTNYEVPEGVRVRQIVLDNEADADKAYKRAMAGEDFETLVKLLSVDEATKSQGGSLGWLKRGGYVQGVGYSEEYEEAAFSLEEGEIAKPFEAYDRWYVVKCEKKREHYIQEFDDVKAQIFNQLYNERREDAMERAYARLEEAYDVERFGWARSYDDMTVDELLTEAEAAVMPSVQIEIYKKIHERFPDDEMADKALFMVGFIYSEELGDYEEAAVYFRKLKEEYPTSDFVKPADWMLENMGKDTSDLIELPEGSGE
ncbi:MAG: peptidyl-prolyl cis-trans isomerase [Candidatus Coatesbacteria bacterium]|nr:MAG: peptidyl-prolyl cis-trans isomerase [Candidatus Coatesbacteria bacterium]